ncbi:MAG: flagellar hook-associated protein FlgL [Chloroflexi bacterium]|nr:flagellar hook-associated protein FlgL [Chloroflexota bacterium]MBV9131175.1 flagellar hook-associated protein FlgL [Chloroflexota bacterium]MBV9896617.1 flagellar hook-associated protein FlgL [Chloroflexota bacterium]
MRITQTMLTQTTLNNIENNMTRIDQLEGQVTSGTRISKPSDDPIGAARALGFQESVDQSTQYLANIDQASGWLNATDSALAGVTDAIQRARELAVQAANGTLSASDRGTIATEVTQLQAQVLGQAQAKHGASFLFAGTKSDQPGFLNANPSATPGSYQGNHGSVLRQVAPGQTVAVNVDPTTTFDPVFTAINNLQTGLTTNNQTAISNSINDLDTALTSVMGQRATVGAMTNRLDTLQQQMSSIQVNMTGLLSNVKDVDMAQAITQFSMAQSVYQASLSAGAKAMQPSLLDYLK